MTPNRYCFPIFAAVDDCPTDAATLKIAFAAIFVAARVVNGNRRCNSAAPQEVLQPMQRVIEGIVYFSANQVIKTARRPSRAVLIPYHLVLRPVLMRLGRLAMPIILWCVRSSDIPARLVPKSIARLIAYGNFFYGNKLLGENNPEEARRVFTECIRFSDDDNHFKIAAVNLQVGLGRNSEAIELHKQSNRIRLLHRAAVGAVKYDRYCLLDLFWAVHIGHAATIDYVVKLRMLDDCNPSDTILYVPPGINVANRFLVEQWRPHLRLITDPRQLPFPEEYVRYFALDYYVPGMTGSGKYYWWELAAQTYRRWTAESRPYLLRLPAEVQERGRNALASLGVPPDAWFVGLHVREPGYHVHHRDLHDVLNAKIDNYLPAIDEIVRRGGWVIRMGDPSMTPLPPLANVLDYCHSAIRSDWMDVFLAGTSRFFIGTSSGVCYVAQAYGVPCVLTNWWPPAQRPWHAGDIFVPKLLRGIGDGRVLLLEESLNEPFGYCNSVNYLREKHGVAVQDNHPEDIRAAVVEMFERMEGRPNYDQSDLAMHERAENIYASTAMRLYGSPGAFGAGALARDFLRRNQSFLET